MPLISLPAPDPRRNDDPATIVPEGNPDWCPGRSSKPYGVPSVAGVSDSHCLPPPSNHGILPRGGSHSAVVFCRVHSLFNTVNRFTQSTHHKGMFQIVLLICIHSDDDVAPSSTVTAHSQ